MLQQIINQVPIPDVQIPTTNWWAMLGVSLFWILVLLIWTRNKVALKRAEGDAELRKELDEVKAELQREKNRTKNLEVAFTMLHEYMKGQHRDDPQAMAMFSQVDRLIENKP